MINPLSYPIRWPVSWGEPADIIHATLLVASVTALVWMVSVRPGVGGRLAYMLAWLLILFAQLPLVITSPMVMTHLPSAWTFAISIHLTVFALVGWVGITSRWNLPLSKIEVSTDPSKGWFVCGGFVIVLIAIYLMEVPWRCTPLYALLELPPLVLLVRELVGKIAHVPAAHYALGWAVNVAIPAFGFLLVWQARTALHRSQWLLGFGWITALVFVLALPLLSGAKGNLIPAILTLAIASAVMQRHWFWRLVTGGAILVGLMIVVTGVNIATTPSARSGGTALHYDMKRCMPALQACEGMHTLLHSLTHRDESLGLTKDQIAIVSEQHAAVCPSAPLSSQATLSSVPTDPLISSGSVSTPSWLQRHIPDYPYRLLRGLFQRAFVMPFQVAVWHWLYVDEYGSPGVSALPIVHRFIDTPHMPARIYQAYGAIYAAGDRTHTSTAPTSYLFFYPAYWGVLGLLAALILTCIYDALLAFISSRLRAPYAYLAVGLTASIALNLLVADFFTTMLSHGAGLALVLLMMCVWLDRRSGSAEGASR